MMRHVTLLAHAQIDPILRPLQIFQILVAGMCLGGFAKGFMPCSSGQCIVQLPLMMLRLMPCHAVPTTDLGNFGVQVCVQVLLRPGYFQNICSVP